MSSFLKILNCGKSSVSCRKNRAWEFTRVSFGIRYNKVLLRVEQTGQCWAKRSAPMLQSKNKTRLFRTPGKDLLWCVSFQNSLCEAEICVLLEFNNASPLFCYHGPGEKKNCNCETRCGHTHHCPWSLLISWLYRCIRRGDAGICFYSYAHEAYVPLPGHIWHWHQQRKVLGNRRKVL